MDQASALQLYATRVREAITEEQAKLSRLQGFQDQLSSTHELLETLPRKLQHHISVPFGRHAFFPGTLRHTNEYKVHLGAGYYLHCTAYEAGGIIQRRLDRIASLCQAVHKQIDEHQARLSVADGSTQQGLFPGIGPDGEQVMEIRESYEDSEALLASAKPASSVPAAAVPTTSQPAPAPSHTQSQQQQQPTSGSAVDQAEFDAYFARLEALEALAEQQQDSAAQGNGDSATNAGPASQMLADEVDVPDSDDEDEDEDVDWAAAFAPVSLSAQPPQPAQPAKAVPTPTPDTSSSQPGTSQASRPSSAAGTSSKAAGSAPLKKGFLLAASQHTASRSGSKSNTSPPQQQQQQQHQQASGAASWQRSSAGPGGAGSRAASSQAGGTAGAGDEAAEKAAALEQARREAFTGQVMERQVSGAGQQPAASAAPPVVVGAVSERVPDQAEASQHQEQPRMSKFKMMRRGML